MFLNWLVPESGSFTIKEQPFKIVVRQDKNRRTIAIESEQPVEFDLAIRIPAYVKAARIECGGKRYDSKPGEYCHVRRVWSDDEVTVTLVIVPETVDAAPYGQAGRVMLRR